MTEKTASFSVRVPVEVKEKIAGELTRSCLEGLVKQIERGEIVLTSDGVSVNTYLESVNTKQVSVNTSDCDNCPYMDDLDLSKFNEVCEFKGIERQKAIDKCVQMLWR